MDKVKPEKPKSKHNAPKILILIVLVIVVLAAAAWGISVLAARNSQQKFAGSYTFREEGLNPAHTGSIDSGTKLVVTLNKDFTATVKEINIGETVTFEASGTWKEKDNTVSIDLKDTSGGADIPLDVQVSFSNGFPSDIEIYNLGINANLSDSDVNFGTGDNNKFVQAAQEKLASLPYTGLKLNEIKLGTFDEKTRRAIVIFQLGQGILPHGVLDLQTWTLLQNPKPPLPEAIKDPFGSQVEAVQKFAYHPPAYTSQKQPILYFTFDDGPDSQNTQKIADLFKKYGGNATFFEIGERVNTFPAISQSLAKASFQIGNHTLHHVGLSQKTSDEVKQEVVGAEQAIQKAIGGVVLPINANLKYLRPPFGYVDDKVAAVINPLGYKVVVWDIDTQDWRMPGPNQMVAHLLDSVKPGSVILMHDGGGDRSQTIQTLESVLPILQQQGYVFKSVNYQP